MTEPLVQQVLDAANESRALCIRGGGTKDFYGQALVGETLDTRSCTGIVSYAPSELVLTARAGTTLREIDASLATHDQFLPFEPPQFGTGATIGGVIAAGLSGPGRQARGAARDFVLGAKLLDGQGEILRFGGQVMKNVAGYDVSRALAGSMGTLGVIVEVSLKVLPRPASTVSLRFGMDAAQALVHMSRWAAEPLPVSATAWCENVLTVRLSGSAASVVAAARRLGGEAIAASDADQFWDALRDHRLPFFEGNEPLWRVALPALTPGLDLPGSQCLEWDGTQRWIRTSLDANAVRAEAARAKGHATLFRATPAEKERSGVFTARSPALARIERELRMAFDPSGIFNRGRIDPVL